MRIRVLGLAVFVAAVLLSPTCNVEACSPDFGGDVFVAAHSPDDMATFGSGRLGILQPGFDSNEYAVAYRYLNGGKLSTSEQKAYLPPPPEPQTVLDRSELTPDQLAAVQAVAQAGVHIDRPVGNWMLTRAQYAPLATPVSRSASFPTDQAGIIEFDPDYLDCPDPAFVTATLTLKSRAETWGKHSALLADWIQAQDAVFSNCERKNGAIPSPVAADSPALLKADRAYQIASATFYARHFDEAAGQFAAIASDTNSPWSSWGQYLAARATVRKAFAMGNATDQSSGDVATYDPETMHRAQQMLEELLSHPNPLPSRSVIQQELNFIRIRTEPEKRASEICAALAGPGEDTNFLQDIRDLNWLLVKNIKIENPPPLLAWIAAWRTSYPVDSAYDQWKQNHALPWLIIAMIKADPADKIAPQLLADAASIAPKSPAYDTVFYHRVRLLTGLKRSDEARALLDAALPPLQRQKPNSECPSRRTHGRFARLQRVPEICAPHRALD